MSADGSSVAPTVLDTAADWFALRRSGQMTAQMLFELEVWLESDPAHLSAYKDVARTWALTHAVSSDPELLALREEARGRSGRGKRAYFVASAAAAIALLCGVVWFAGGLNVWRDLTAPVSDQHFRTALGETRSVILADGSAVTLDSDTVLDVHETWRARALTLRRGQGFFLVARDPDRPFTVSAAGNTVTATGTAFDVRIDPGRFLVLLSEGRLHVAIPQTGDRPQEQTDLEPGWQLEELADGQRTLTHLMPASEERALGWRIGQLAFLGRPLAAVAAEMNRYSPKKIAVAPELASHPIDGVFRAGDIEGFVRLVVASKLARVENDTPAQVLLGPRKNTSKFRSP